MADEAAKQVQTGLTEILAGQEEEAAEDLRRLQAGEAPAKETPAEVPPSETPEAAPASPPAAASPPVAETPPAAEKPPQQSGEGWKQARINERKAKEAEERAAHFERLAKEYETKLQGGTPAATADVPDFNTDPASNLLHRAETAEQRMTRIETENAQTRQQLAQQQELAAVQAQEAAFTQEHPDYPQAVKHLINSELEEFRMGPKQAAVARMNQALMSGDAQMKQAVDSLAAMGFEEDAAIGTIAEQTYINSRAAQLREAARVMGKPVPELGYAFAQRRGWQAPTATTAPATATQADAALTRVRQAQQISRGAQTLSEMDTTSPQQERRFTRAQVAQMTDEEFASMEAEDPQGLWYRG